MEMKTSENLSGVSASSAKNFIAGIAPVIQKYAKQYGYKVVSPIIAQACIESKYGTSSLAYKYYNYFGMKCGSSWKGKSVNLQTKEEYTVGMLTTIKDNFRVYDSMEEGIEGYFKFISTSGYANLKTATTAKQYLEYIKADGYATSSTYVTTCMNVVTQYNLTSYDITESTTESKYEEKLKIDGLWGPATTKRLQEIFCTIVDSRISNQPISEKTRNPGLASQSCWDWKNNPSGGSLLIKAIQKKVEIAQSGFIDENTITAMQKWLGTTQDGLISNPSLMVKALQTWCNEQ